MSTIWTPGGEYTPKPEPVAAPEPPPERGDGEFGEQGGRQPTPEELQAALAEAQAILGIPVEEHLAGHAMSLFELASLQLQREAVTDGNQPVDLAETSLAIDALGALVEGLGPRLGRYHEPMTEALKQLRLAYVRARED